MTRVVKLAALMLLLLLVAAATATAVGVGLANSCVAQAESWRNRDDCLTSAWKLEQCLDGKRNASRTLPTVGVWEWIVSLFKRHKTDAQISGSQLEFWIDMDLKKWAVLALGEETRYDPIQICAKIYRPIVNDDAPPPAPIPVEEFDFVPCIRLLCLLLLLWFISRHVKIPRWFKLVFHWRTLLSFFNSIKDSENICVRQFHPSEFRRILGGKLGEGSFGAVFKAVHIRTNRLCALKFMDPNDAEHEFDINRALDHPNVVPIKGRYHDSAGTALVFALMEGSLQDLISRGRKFSRDERKAIIRDLAEGLLYLKSKNILHNDIKPANILINSGRFLIGDFGLSERRHFARGFVGSRPYASPENVKCEYFSFANDTWSLGIVAFVLSQCEFPFNTTSQICNTELKFPHRIHFWERDLLERILVKDPESRISIEEVLGHPWLRNR